MARLSKILRSMMGGKRLLFWCPGCEDCHIVVVEGPNAWGYNGNPEAPTFTPSVLVEYGVGGKRCHSFVTDGKIAFLSDCTHALAGQTVPLAEWPENFDDGDATTTPEAP